MHLKDYINQILNTITANPYVESQRLSFEERPPDAAYINGVIIFIGGTNQNLVTQYLIFRLF